MRVGIAIDSWKLPIFERHLRWSGYSWKNAGQLTSETLLLQVETNNVEALHVVVKAANDEAARTGAPK